MIFMQSSPTRKTDMGALDPHKKCELHVHSGGCLYADDLLDLGRQVYEQVDWRLFVDSYEQAFGVRPDPLVLFREALDSSPGGLDRFRQHRKPAAYLAKRFAAKEAFSKAMGTGIHFPVNWHNVSVRNGRSGRPLLQFSAPLEVLLRSRGVTAAHLSLTDEIGMACAFVVLEGG